MGKILIEVFEGLEFGKYVRSYTIFERGLEVGKVGVGVDRL